ncbi:hypothetical protein [Pseudonocardia zijingensis]|uniref:Uncharacterized protein n=1 Tax=Pseudonocardia zijingensis TaxID=153376 RepID=A0ABP3YRY5_9PSEU
MRALPDGRIQWITPTGHRYHSHPHDHRPDTSDELPPNPAATPKGLPKDLAAHLERLHRARAATARWNNGPIPSDDTDDAEDRPPF